jgi:hypothetical protein
MDEPIIDTSRKFEPKKTQLFRLKNSPKDFLTKAQKAVLTYFAKISLKY